MNAELPERTRESVKLPMRWFNLRSAAQLLTAPLMGGDVKPAQAVPRPHPRAVTDDSCTSRFCRTSGDDLLKFRPTGMFVYSRLKTFLFTFGDGCQRDQPPALRRKVQRNAVEHVLARIRTLVGAQLLISSPGRLTRREWERRR